MLGVRKALFNASRLALFVSRKKQVGHCRRSGVLLLRVPADRSERRSLRGARPLHAAKQPFDLASLAILFRISLSGFLYIYLPFYTFTLL